jgi:hypothetical protein
MPLDDPTGRHTKAKPAAPSHSGTIGVRQPNAGPIKIAPAPPQPANHAELRANFDSKLADLRLVAKTTKDRRALEYWAATEAERLDGRWRKDAGDQAVKGHVLPDLKLNPLDAGTKATVYSSKLLTIGLQVDRRAAATDVDAMVAFLEKNGVKPALLKVAVRKCTPKPGVANVFTALLVAG